MNTPGLCTSNERDREFCTQYAMCMKHSEQTCNSCMWCVTIHLDDDTFKIWHAYKWMWLFFKSQKKKYRIKLSNHWKKNFNLFAGIFLFELEKKNFKQFIWELKWKKNCNYFLYAKFFGQWLFSVFHAICMKYKSKNICILEWYIYIYRYVLFASKIIRIIYPLL